MIKELNDNNFNELIQNNLALVFFCTECGPCKKMLEVLEKTNELIIKVNTDDSIELASIYKVVEVPTIILFKYGEIVDKLVGFHSEEEINSFIKNIK